MALLTVKQVAERLGVSQATIYEMCARRKLTHLRLGVGRGTIRLRDEDLDAFLQEATVQPDEPTAPQPSSATKRGTGSGFKNLDGDRLLEAWRRQGVLAGPPDERSAPSSASSCDPSAPPES
jgi:excisionase family DNA binding protein